MNNNPYQLSDKAIHKINLLLTKELRKLNSIVNIDEANVLDKVKVSFSSLYKKLVFIFLNLAHSAYKNANGKNKKINEDWLNLMILDIIHPNYAYKFNNEWERKMYRYAEILQAPNNQKILNTSKNHLTLMTNQYCDYIEDITTLEAYKENGIEKVRWITENDEKVCSVCTGRHLKIYHINKIPPKPHLRCRCWYEPIKISED